MATQIQKTKTETEGGQPKAVISSPKKWDKWRAIAERFFHAPGSMSYFYVRLCTVIQTADPDNLGRLRKGFPELVEYIKEGV